MIRKLRPLACLAVVMLAACDREPPAAPTAESPAAPTFVAGSDAVAAAPTAVPSPDAPTAFDQKAFAGTFVAGANRLELVADGAYRMTANGAATDGTWTAEENDTRIRLDPNSKSEPDRVFAMTSRDELTALAADGQPAAGADAMSLKRDAN